MSPSRAGDARGDARGEARGEARGGVLLLHDAYGLTSSVRSACDQLATHGFVVIAPDLFAGASARSDTDASRLLETLTVERAARVLDAAVAAFDVLGHHRGPLATVGFSVGAEFGFDLVATRRVRAAVAYDALPRTDPAVGFGAALLLHLAEHDRWDDDDRPDRVVAALRARGVDVVVRHHRGTFPGFANPGLDAFDAPAADPRLARQRAVPHRASRGRMTTPSPTARVRVTPGRALHTTTRGRPCPVNCSSSRCSSRPTAGTTSPR